MDAHSDCKYLSKVVGKSTLGEGTEESFSSWVLGLYGKLQVVVKPVQGLLRLLIERCDLR